MGGILIEEPFGYKSFEPIQSPTFLEQRTRGHSRKYENYGKID